MKHLSISCVWGAVVLLVLCIPSSFAKGTDLQFRGRVSDVMQSGPNEGSVVVDLLGFSVTVAVNSDTEIESSGDDEDLGSISIMDFIKVEGFFSDTGIVAEEIEVLDTSIRQFRLRGPIESLVTVGSESTMRVNGVDVTLDGSTQIRRRGPGSSSDSSISDLTTGVSVDTSGRVNLDFQFYAEKVRIGDRPEGEAEIEGVVTSVDGDLVFVDIEAGGIVGVVVTDTTEVRGDIVPGAFVEVEGDLNDQLQIVSREFSVDVDGDRDADDDHRGDGDDDGGDDGGDDDGRVEIGREIPLLSVESGAEIHGKAEFKYKEEDGPAQQEFEVEFEDAPANTSYAVWVEFTSGAVEFGTLTTDEFGSADVEFDSSPEIDERDLNAVMPAGSDVRDIISVEIRQDGSLVLAGSFS